MALVCEAAFVADFCEAFGCLCNVVACFLDTKVADVFFGCHVEACFEFSQE